MADRKISDLTALTTPASGDFLPIVDISEAAAASKNKRITIEELMRGVPDGTAAAPSIAFETDPNTGIYRAGTDSLAVATNGAGRLLIDASGNVGVGTSLPSNQLTVSANTLSSITLDWIGDNLPKATFSANHATGEVRMGATNNSGSYFATLYSNNQERLRITSAGLVGIGTSSPNTILHTAQDASTYIRVQRTTSGTEGNLYLGCTSSANQIISEGSSSVAKALRFDVGSMEAMRIDSSGRLGIGTTSPSRTLDVVGTARFSNGNADITIYGDITTAGALGTNSNFPLALYTNGSEKARIDTSGRLLVGTSTARGDVIGSTGNFQLEGVSGCIQTLVNNQASANDAQLLFGKTRGASAGSNTAVASGDALGLIAFGGADGTSIVQAAHIRAVVDGTPGASDMPGRLVFSTTADGAASPTERVRITSTGQVRLAGAGITFNGDTAAANELDDYEEGTWTPVVFDTTNADISSLFTTAGNYARYTKIGRVVTITFALYSGDATVSQLIKRIEGLPFTLANFNFGVGAVQFAISGKSNGDRTVSSSANAYMNHSEASIRINNSISIAQFGTGVAFTAVFFNA